MDIDNLAVEPLKYKEVVRRRKNLALRNELEPEPRTDYWMNASSKTSKQISNLRDRGGHMQVMDSLRDPLHAEFAEDEAK